MSDRFDMMLERKLETKPEGGDGDVVGVRRIELISGTVRRRDWPSREKARILVESAEAGANISDVARRNGLSPQQLFGWRREARELLAGSVPAPIETPATSTGQSPRSRNGAATRDGARASVAAQHFAPVILVAAAATPPPASPPPSPSGPGSCGVIEIVIGGCVVRIVGKVDARALDAVLASVRRAS